MNLHDIGSTQTRILGPEERFPTLPDWINDYFRAEARPNNFFRAEAEFRREAEAITASDLRFAFDSLNTPRDLDPVVEVGRTVRYMISDIARLRDRLLGAGFLQTEVDCLAIKVSREQYRMLQEFQLLEGGYRGPVYDRQSGTMRVMGMTVLPV